MDEPRSNTPPMSSPRSKPRWYESPTLDRLHADPLYVRWRRALAPLGIAVFALSQVWKDAARWLLGIGMVLVTAAFFAAIAHRAHRRRVGRLRAARGECKACGYTRAGLDAASPCPECGAKS